MGIGYYLIHANFVLYEEPDESDPTSSVNINPDTKEHEEHVETQRNLPSP